MNKKSDVLGHSSILDTRNSSALNKPAPKSLQHSTNSHTQEGVYLALEKLTPKKERKPSPFDKLTPRKVSSAAEKP